MSPVGIGWESTTLSSRKAVHTPPHAGPWGRHGLAAVSTGVNWYKIYWKYPACHSESAIRWINLICQTPQKLSTVGASYTIAVKKASSQHGHENSVSDYPQDTFVHQLPPGLVHQPVHLGDTAKTKDWRTWRNVGGPFSTSFGPCSPVNRLCGSFAKVRQTGFQYRWNWEISETKENCTDDSIAIVSSMITMARLGTFPMSS